MCYIKESILTTSITVCTMERHEAGQQEALVEVRMGKESSEAIHLPRGSPAGRPGCLKCAVALATVMGFVIVALVASFSMHLFMFTPSCNQDVRPSCDTAKLSITCKLEEEKQGRCEIFTVNKTALYSIYGWVKLSDITKEEDVTLEQTVNGNQDILQHKKSREGEVFFLEKIRMVSGTRISLYFPKSSYTDSWFLLYELRN